MSNFRNMFNNQNAFSASEVFVSVSPRAARSAPEAMPSSMAKPEGRFFAGADVYEAHFQTPMVKIIAGTSPNSRTFYAHEGILSKTEFFSRALNGRFRESTTREVELPEDDPETFSSILEFLYGEEYSPRLITEKLNKPGARAGATSMPGYFAAPEQPDQLCAAAMRHAKIYCLADKLGITDLQKLVLEKLRLCGPLKDLNFLKVAAYLMANSSDCNGELSAFLKPYIQGIPRTSLG